MVPEDFDSLLKSVERIFPGSRLEMVADSGLAVIREQFPGIPDHYLAFLRNVGWGSLGDGNFMIYSSPCEPDEFFDVQTSEELDGIVFWGDDFAGWMAGFDTRDGWRIVGVDSASPRPYPEEAQTVGAFIARRVAQNPDTPSDPS